jgi:hypothetical protein
MKGNNAPHTSYNIRMTATACLAVRRACSVQGAEETRGTGGEAQEPTAACAQADGLTIEMDVECRTVMQRARESQQRARESQLIFLVY